MTSEAKGGESLRVGVNPEGAYSVRMVDGEGKVVAQGFELEGGVQCQRNTPACWNCKVRRPGHNLQIYIILFEPSS